MSSVSNALALSQLQVAVARKQLDSIEQQGQAALALIEATAPPTQAGAPANAGAMVGTRLNVVA